MKKEKLFKVGVINESIIDVVKDMTTFYTSDTELWLGFELSEEGVEFDSAEILMFNIDNKSFVVRSVVKTDDKYWYEIDMDIIAHHGEWKAQLQFTKNSEVYTSKHFDFRIENDLSNERPPKLIDITNWSNIKHTADSLIAEMKVAVTESIAAEQNRADIFSQAESERQTTFEVNESGRDETFSANEVLRQGNETTRQEAETQRASAEFVRVANEAERISKDSERDSKLEVVEDSIVGKLIGGYTFNRNIEVHATNLEEETGVFIATNHGLVNGMRCAVALNLDTPLINKTSLPYPLQTGWRYIVNATQDTFQVSDSRDGEPVLFTQNPSLDTNLWHLEATNSPVTSINLQGFSETELTIRFRVKSHAQGDNVFRITLDDIETANNFYSEVEGLLTRDIYPALLNYGHSNLAMFGEYKASLSDHAMIGKLEFYRADLATRNNPHSKLTYKVFKDTIWATNTNKIDAFRGVGLNLGGHMLLNGSTLEVYNG